MPPRLSSARLAALVLPLFVTTASCDSNTPCYFPSGSPALEYYACDATAFVTTCCPLGWTCYSNSLCVVTTPSASYLNLTLGAAKRGACTNPLWNNAICGNICLDGGETSGDLAACGGDRFCCSEDYASGDCDCSPSGSAFTISSGVYQSIVGLPSTRITGTPSYSLVSSLATPSTANSSSVATATPTTKASASSAASATAANPSPTTTEVSSSSDSSHARNLGLGLGLGFGLSVFLALVGWVIYVKLVRPRQKDRKIYQEDEHPPRPVEPPLRNPYDGNGGIPENTHEDEYVYASRAHRSQVAPASNPYDSAA
jgi:hypothetical protein